MPASLGFALSNPFVPRLQSRLCFSGDRILLESQANRHRVIMSADGGTAIFDTAMEKDSRHAVICGAGVIGACTAYYLSQKGFQVTVFEKCGVACAASGKAGGFLALGWSRGAVGQLANASFRLHEQLAQELEEDYGYRKVNTLSMVVNELAEGSKRKTAAGGAGLAEWIDGPIRSSSSIGTPATTAQVHPKLFTNAILNAAVQKYGAKIRIGEVQEVQLAERTKSAESGGRRVTGVMVDGEIVAADVVVLAMGPWSSRNKLIGQLTKISGLKANSVVLKPPNPEAISADMLFLQYKTKEGRHLEPEVYPRPTGEVYVCGMSEEVDVPEDPNNIHPSADAPKMLRRVAATVSSQLADAECISEQACFLPCSEDGAPVIGPIPEVDGAYVATGHSCWGILMAPATGLSLSELIADGSAQTVDLKSFDPQRFLARAALWR